MCFRASIPIAAGLSVYNMESGTGPPLYVFGILWIGWCIMVWYRMMEWFGIVGCCIMVDGLDDDDGVSWH